MSRQIETIKAILKNIQKEQSLRRAIEPARGERKKQLEEDCQNLLRNDRWFLEEDFTQFVSHMIELLGGVEEKSGRNWTQKDSNVLVDRKNGVSILFHRMTSYEIHHKEHTYVQIVGSDVFEKLEQTQLNPKKASKESIPLITESAMLSAEIHLSHPKLFTYDSYISGISENVFSDGVVKYQRGLHSPDEGQEFCQRVFNTYQDQTTESS